MKLQVRGQEENNFDLQKNELSQKISNTNYVLQLQVIHFQNMSSCSRIYSKIRKYILSKAIGMEKKL